MKKSILKTNIREIVNTIDSETAELLSTQEVRHTFIANSKEEFFLGYVTLLSVFKDMSGPAIKVYSFLLLHNKPGSPIGISGGMKKQIMTFIGSKSKGTVENALTELVKISLIFRDVDSKGIYYINPRYAFKGSTGERNSALKAIIELGCKEC